MGSFVCMGTRSEHPSCGRRLEFIQYKYFVSNTIRNMSDTLFLLDMLRNSNQEKIRAQKDAMILDMAMEQKRKMQEAKKPGSKTYSNAGGFIGVDQLASSKTYSNAGGFIGVDQLARNSTKQSVVKKTKQRDAEENPSMMTQDSEMFILGLLKEQRQEEIYKERVQQISEESLGCVSDENCLKKFGN